MKLVEVPWAREGSGFTLLFEGFVLALVKAMPVAAAARLVGEHDTRLWRILHHYVDRAREEADFSEVIHVGVDETSASRGQSYITLFADLDEAKVLLLPRGTITRPSAASAWTCSPTEVGPEQIAEFCMNMSAGFLKGARRQFPEAGIVFDKFHVMKLVNDAVDEVRRAEQKERLELKRSRYVWLKNPKNLTKKQEALLEAFTPSKLGLKTARAYRIKLALQDFWTLPPALAEDFLDRWYFWATHSRLEPMIRVAKTLKEHSRASCIGSGPGSATESWRPSTAWSRLPRRRPAATEPTAT